MARKKNALIEDKDDEPDTILTHVRRIRTYVGWILAIIVIVIIVELISWIIGPFILWLSS